MFIRTNTNVQQNRKKCCHLTAHMITGVVIGYCN